MEIWVRLNELAIEVKWYKSSERQYQQSTLELNIGGPMPSVYGKCLSENDDNYV